MKITLSTYGGLAAGVRRPARVLDSAKLQKPDAERLQSLVALAKTSAAPPPNERMRDGRSYEIRVQEDDRGETTITQGDGSMSPAFADLLQFVAENA